MKMEMEGGGGEAKRRKKKRKKDGRGREVQRLEAALLLTSGKHEARDFGDGNF